MCLLISPTFMMRVMVMLMNLVLFLVKRPGEMTHQLSLFAWGLRLRRHRYALLLFDLFDLMRVVVTFDVFCCYVRCVLLLLLMRFVVTFYTCCCYF